jgi:hypothetical protein
VADRDVAVTWWPRVASWGRSRLPIAPLPPTTRTRMTFVFPSCRWPAVTPGGVAVSLLLTREKKGT